LLVVAAVAASSLFAIACQLFLDIDLTSERRAAGDAQAPSADPCVHAHPAEAPAGDAPGTPMHDGGPLVFAVRRFFFDEQDDAGLDVPPGFDLDGVCTCAGGPGAAYDGGGSCRGPKQACDDDGGSDRAANPAFESYAANIGGSSPKGANERITTGQGTMLFELRDYKGLPDERQVLVWTYPSNGIWPTNADGTAFRYVSAGYQGDGQYCYALAGGGCESPIAPAWDGEDRWSVDPGAFFAPGDLPRINAEGYVRDGVLVMRRESLPIVVPFGDVPVPFVFNGAILVGRLVPGASGWTIRGRITGRLSIADALTAVASVRLEGQPICATPSLYDQLHQEMCGLADIMSSPALDDTNAVCDAVSLSLGFVAEPARRGLPLYDVPDAGPGCAAVDRTCPPQPR
jgi:hypothetical protein